MSGEMKPRGTSGEVELRPLCGRNPRGLFAALGALDVVSRQLPEQCPTLRFTDSIEPHAVLTGPRDLDHLVALCDRDRARWENSPILAWGPEGRPLDDLKPRAESELPAWIGAVAEPMSVDDRADVDLLAGLVSEGARAGKGDAKPTHFHFTAGNQRFLAKVRELRSAIGPEDLREALGGPWRYESKLSSLGWDVGGEKLHAYRAIAPTRDKTPAGVPGADWLGFLGLRFFPVLTSRGRLLTTGCERGWKDSAFTWPLWNVGLTADVVRALIGRGDLAAMSDAERRVLGVHRVLRSPIRRTDQGGYGSFGAPDLIVRERVRRGR
jgi:hypothetical protein